MTRKILSAVAVAVAVFFTGSLVAQAAEVTFGGQLRPRYEVRHQSDSTGVNNEFVSMRTRLNTNVKVDENTSAFIQFQMNSTFGSAPGPGPALANQAAFNPNSANDSSTEVGMHQAYFTLKNLFGAPVSAKIGRQEIVLDGHRLFGNTGWTHGSQAHDAAIFSHTADKMTVLYAWSKLVEGLGAQDENNVEAHLVWFNMKDAVGAGSSTSAYLVNVDNDAGTPGPTTHMWTAGVRHAGAAGDIDYRGEFYYQTGKTAGIDTDAFMAGLRAGYKMSAVPMKPKITLWGDYLSGNDLTDTDLGGFDVLFDTGHKFYGLQDIMLGAGVFGSASSGLIDLALKLALHPMANLTVKVDAHNFTRAEDNAAGTDGLGQELDITVIHKCSANVKMVGGFSYFAADSDFAAEDMTWAYAMVDVSF